jgi:hypothetical protein
LRHDEDGPGPAAGPAPSGISAEQYAELFAGDEPIDPDRFRKDIDRVANPACRLIAADDWDSTETNAAIASQFSDGDGD